MKELFTLINDPRFHLLYGVTQRFSPGPAPTHVRLNRERCTLCEGVKKNTRVFPHMRLAVHEDPLKGDLFSPVFGTVTEVSGLSLLIEAGEPDEDARARAAAVEKTDLFALSERGEALRPLLKALGLNTGSLGQPCDTLIINGLNPDPGVTWAEPMLLTHHETFERGVEMLRRLSPAKRIVLAAPRKMRLQYHDLEVVGVDDHYPVSVNEILVKAATGRERPAGVGVVGLHTLWSLGRVARTGLPLVETVITLGGLRHSGNYIVKVGSTLAELLAYANIELKSGDAVIRGGPLRGESVDNLEWGVTPGSTGVFVVEAGTIPPMKGHSPCINCGACVSICPARLDPRFLSRYAEFIMYERCLTEHIDSCLECGLCGYVCINRRPVLQYILLAKHRLAEMKAGRKDEEAPSDASRGGEA